MAKENLPHYVSGIQLAAIRAGLRAAGQTYIDEVLGKVQDAMDEKDAELARLEAEVKRLRAAPEDKA